MKPAPKQTPKRKRINLDIRVDVYKRLKAIASIMQRSMNATVEQLVEKWDKP